MTTKRKIIMGFLLVNVLLIVVAIIGYRSLSVSSEGFRRYDELAHSNVELSDMQTELYTQAYRLQLFITTREKKDADAAIDSMKRMIDLGNQVAANMKIETNRKNMAELLKISTDYVNLLQDIQERVLSWDAHYKNVLRPAAAAVQTAIVTVDNGARANNNSEVLNRLGAIWTATMTLRTQITLFADNGSAAAAESMAVEFAAVREGIERLRPIMLSAKGREDFAMIFGAFEALEQGINSRKERFMKTNELVQLSYEYDKKITDGIAAFNKETSTLMDQTAKDTVVSNKAAQTQMFVISFIGVVMGVAFALFIIVGLIKVLNRVGAYATAVAEGQFGHDPRILEKGEIGAMVEALKRIPDTLASVISQCNAAAAEITRGEFRARLEEENFHGGFKELATGVNTVANSYTIVIDELPVSIMVNNKERKILFLNSHAQIIAGGNAIGEFCGDKLRANECNGDGCFGKRCLATDAPAHGEVSVETPQGKKYLSVAAVPMRDIEDRPAGSMEIITDITQIKNQQITMAEVARSALDISDRVAAASEELSSQVEQISRGAEMQRERVESTASAMTEMNATVLEVARSAGEASDQSENTRLKAQEGATLVNEVMSSINEVNTVGQSLQVNMQELGQQAESIGNVMNVISDIADQTNLLALNAAIEAARAGDAGRGFAVVADEVRKLAEKTMEATQEVGSSINAVQSSARVNIDEVGKAVSSVSEANSLANSSGTALSEIVNMASANSSVVASIAAAAEQQSATSEEISRAIDEINQIVGETTEGMIQSSQAVQDLSRMAQELKNLLDNLK